MAEKNTTHQIRKDGNFCPVQKKYESTKSCSINTYFNCVSLILQSYIQFEDFEDLEDYKYLKLQCNTTRIIVLAEKYESSKETVIKQLENKQSMVH